MFLFDFQVPRLSDFWTAATAAVGRTLRSQRDPSPKAPRYETRRKEPMLPQIKLKGLLVSHTLTLCRFNIAARAIVGKTAPNDSFKEQIF